MRFFGAADRRSLHFLATWRKGGVQRSSEERSSVLCVAEEAPRIRFELQNAASHERVTCRGPAATPLRRRSGRRPDLMGAAQHPRIGRRAIVPSCPSMQSRNSPLLPKSLACNDPRPARANGDVHEKIARGICDSTPSCAAAASVASMMDRQAFSKPIRVVAGPELAAPSTLPFSSSIRARQLVPPPSMPRYVVPFVPMES